MTTNSQITPEQVFITDGFPELTYVGQGGGRLETELKEGLAQANKIVSIVGESKTGKTTLCDKIFGKERILVTGDRIENEYSLWSEAFRQLQSPVTSGYANNSVGETIDLLITRGLPVVLDDFHYVKRELQGAICRQMKNAASRGLRFVVLNTPHRVDDPVRSNPDMSGRFFEVNVGFWSEEDLMQIGIKGFGKLELKVSEDVVRILAREALRSPQLMQTLCLETCRVLSPDKPFEHQDVTALTFDLQKVKDKAVRSYNYSTPLDALRNGPEERGSPRNIYSLADGANGDVYEVLVRILASNPPFLTISLDDLKERTGKLVRSSQQPNVLMALGNTPKLFNSRPPIQWDAGKKQLTVVDPIFIFSFDTRVNKCAFFQLRQERNLCSNQPLNNSPAPSGRHL
jgi:hypothetical protein